MAANPIKFFVSHSTKDAIIVGGVKSFLESYGMDTFIAHEDIVPSREWQEEIIKNLDSCDIFLPIITQNFKDSLWCDQESGIAFEKKRVIMSLNVDLEPYGFLGKYQALKLDKNNLNSSCLRIIDCLKKDERFRERLKDGVIDSLLKSEHFVESNEKVNIVSEMEPFNGEQINKIMRGFVENFEMQGAYRVIANVKIWIKKYNDVIEPNLIKQVNDIIESNI